MFIENCEFDISIAELGLFRVLLGGLTKTHGKTKISAGSYNLESTDDIEMINRYYEGGVSSVYFWDLDDGFAGVVLLKKSM